MLTPRPFTFLRHGETDYNAKGLIQGQRDIPLNAKGRAQAERARDLLARNQATATPIARIVASPLGRALETAETVNQSLDLPISTDPALKECGFGRYEGGSIGPWYQGWLIGQPVPPAPGPDPEPRAAFLARGLAAINAALADADAGAVLIVAHGGIFWSIHHHAALPGDRSLANAQPIHLEPPRPPAAAWRLRAIEERQPE